MARSRGKRPGEPGFDQAASDERRRRMFFEEQARQAALGGGPGIGARPRPAESLAQVAQELQKAARATQAAAHRAELQRRFPGMASEIQRRAGLAAAPGAGLADVARQQADQFEAARLQLNAAKGQQKAGKTFGEGVRGVMSFLPGPAKLAGLATSAFGFYGKMKEDQRRVAFSAAPALESTAAGSQKLLDIQMAKTLNLTQRERDAAYGQQVRAAAYKNNPSAANKFDAWVRTLPGVRWMSDTAGDDARLGAKARAAAAKGENITYSGATLKPPRELLNLQGAAAGLPQSQYMNYGDYTSNAQLASLNQNEMDAKILHEQLEVLKQIRDQRPAGEERPAPQPSRW